MFTTDGLIRSTAPVTAFEYASSKGRSSTRSCAPATDSEFHPATGERSNSGEESTSVCSKLMTDRCQSMYRRFTEPEHGAPDALVRGAVPLAERTRASAPPQTKKPGPEDGPGIKLAGCPE